MQPSPRAETVSSLRFLLSIADLFQPAAGYARCSRLARGGPIGLGMVRRTAVPSGAPDLLRRRSGVRRSREIVAPRARGHAEGRLTGRTAALARRPRISLAGRWATVNVCDTFESPDAMGLRASMPGNGTDQRMYMRFSAQWYSGMRGKWLDVAGGKSPWVYAGSARYKARQAGWSFDFQTPFVRPRLRAARHRAVPVALGDRRARTAPSRDPATGSRGSAPCSPARAFGVYAGRPPGTSKAMCAVANLDIN